MVKKLFYNYCELPYMIRLFRSEDLLSEYNPWDIIEDENNPLPKTIEELFKVLNGGEYTKIEILLTASNDAYFRVGVEPKSEEVIGWIDLADFAHGGPWVNDPLW